jgi:hypothetical protein
MQPINFDLRFTKQRVWRLKSRDNNNPPIYAKSLFWGFIGSLSLSISLSLCLFFRGETLRRSRKVDLPTDTQLLESTSSSIEDGTTWAAVAPSRQYDLSTSSNALACARAVCGGNNRYGRQTHHHHRHRSRNSSFFWSSQPIGPIPARGAILTHVGNKTLSVPYFGPHPKNIQSPDSVPFFLFLERGFIFIAG